MSSDRLRQTAAPSAPKQGNWGFSDDQDGVIDVSAMQGNGLAQMLEKEFLALQRLVATHHANALKLVEQHCSSTVHGGSDTAGSGGQGYGGEVAASNQQTEKLNQKNGKEQPARLHNADEKRKSRVNIPSKSSRLQPANYEDSIKPFEADQVARPVGMSHSEKMEKAYNAQDQARELAKEKKAAMSAGHPPEEHRKKHKGVFADEADMKQKVKEAVLKPEYDVCDFYKTTGVWQSIARTEIFENATLAVIALNSAWIALDTDRNDAETLLDATPFFQIGENLFCAFFAVELFIRFMAFEAKRNCLKDGWFVFDSALVTMMVVETWILNLVFYIVFGGGLDLGNTSFLRLVRLLRLTRMARMIRLLRAMPELLILLKGIGVAMRSVFFTLILLVIVIYVFAIAFTQMAADTPLEEETFPGVIGSMKTLLLVGALPDQADFVEELGEENLLMAFLGLVFILISTLTVLNMLVGVLCEVISVVSAVEKEQLTVQMVKSQLLGIMDNSSFDQDGNKCISKQEFEALLLMPEGARIIEGVGVDVVGLVDFMDDIFKDGLELSFPDFMELILQLRSQNQATVRDIIELRKLISHLISSESAMMVSEIIPQLHYIHNSLDSMRQSQAAGNQGLPFLDRPNEDYTLEGIPRVPSKSFVDTPVQQPAQLMIGALENC
jgi:voltage-gated sodium channel